MDKVAFQFSFANSDSPYSYFKKLLSFFLSVLPTTNSCWDLIPNLIAWGGGGIANKGINHPVKVHAHDSGVTGALLPTSSDPSAPDTHAQPSISLTLQLTLSFSSNRFVISQTTWAFRAPDSFTAVNQSNDATGKWGSICKVGTNFLVCPVLRNTKIQIFSPKAEGRKDFFFSRGHC